MRLQLQCFDFSLAYEPRKELFIADTLSRANLPVMFDDDVTHHCQEQVHAVLHHIIPLHDTRPQYSRATDEDPALVGSTQFASVEFNRFCDKRGVRHITSSSEFPQLNGLAAYSNSESGYVEDVSRCTYFRMYPVGGVDGSSVNASVGSSSIAVRPLAGSGLREPSLCNITAYTQQKAAYQRAFRAEKKKAGSPSAIAI